jgi:hypothetical protein
MQPDDFFSAVEARQNPAPVFPRTLRRNAMTAPRHECTHQGCDRDFGSAQALALHKTRAHGKPKTATGGGYRREAA